MSDDKPTVVVTGDVCYDWNIASTRPSALHNLWKSDEDWGSINPEPGASWLLGKLIKETASQAGNIYGVEVLPRPTTDKNTTNKPTIDENIDHLLNLWGKYPSKDPKNNDVYVWRIVQSLGWQKKVKTDVINEFDPFPNKHRLLVIDDKRFGFRDNSASWPTNFNDADWIMTRMARNLCEGALWEKLIGKKLKDKLIIVVTANDLRHMDVRIRKELSWESTVQDVQEAMSKKTDLLKCKHVIVSFDAAGAVLYTNTGDTVSWKLIYDPSLMEGFTHNNNQGRMQGYAYCLIAAVVNNLLVSQRSEITDDQKRINILVTGIKTGIKAMKQLLDNGYDHVECKMNNETIYEKINFPYKGISECIAPLPTIDVVTTPTNIDCKYYDVELPTTSTVLTPWSIARHILVDGKFDDKLVEIILEGPAKAMLGVPILKLGDKKDICIVDRQEIEELRSISNVIGEYCRRAKENKSAAPLSIAVFGAPGSGKSFLVKNIAKTLDLSITLEFNLSQFSSPEELTGAFHQVCDKCLEGKMPLVFFDEFDSKFGRELLGWLKYFLMPMQDGKFQDKQIAHVLGQCIFVFAGGTCNNFEELDGQKNGKNAKEAKVSDFISRLKGYVSIKGINLEPDEIYADDGQVVKKPEIDVDMVRIKRALLLHSYLNRHAPDIMRRKEKDKIQEGIIKAFLGIKKYSHGARSMESIIQMSRLSGEAEFRTSALPPRELLDLHVNGKEFLKLAGVGD